VLQPLVRSAETRLADVTEPERERLDQALSAARAALESATPAEPALTPVPAGQAPATSSISSSSRHSPDQASR
jgi:hypothetical protein